jgi:SSS family solute:Na+ symporter
MGLSATIVIIYLAGIFIVGAYMARYVHTFEDYNLGGGLGWILLIGTVIATQWGGGTFLGISGMGYNNLYQAASYALSAAPRFLFWALLLAIPIRKIRPNTASEWFALRYDDRCGYMITIINLVIGVALLGAQFVAFGNAVQVFLGWSLETSIIVGALIVTVYTIAGGILAVAMTDAVQLVICFIGAISVLAVSMGKFGNFEALRQALPAEYFIDTKGFLYFISVTMLWMADLPLQYVTQRISSARDLKIAYWVPIIGAVSFVLVAFISPSIGAYARVALPNLARSEQAFPALTLAIMSPWAAGIVISGLLAAIMSTADSYLLAPATLATHDLYQTARPDASDKEVLNVSRIFTVVYTVLGLLVALKFKVILKLALTFLTIGWATLPAYFASTTWKRATNGAAFWSMLIGSGINAYLMTWPPAVLQGYEAHQLGWIGFGVALVILVVGSLLSTPQDNKEDVAMSRTGF